MLVPCSFDADEDSYLIFFHLQHNLAPYPSLFEPQVSLDKRGQEQDHLDDRLDLPLLNQAAQCIQCGTCPLAVREVDRHVFVIACIQVACRTDNTDQSPRPLCGSDISGKRFVSYSIKHHIHSCLLRQPIHRCRRILLRVIYGLFGSQCLHELPVAATACGEDSCPYSPDDLNGKGADSTGTAMNQDRFTSLLLHLIKALPGFLPQVFPQGIPSTPHVDPTRSQRCYFVTFPTFAVSLYIETKNSAEGKTWIRAIRNCSLCWLPIWTAIFGTLLRHISSDSISLPCAWKVVQTMLKTSFRKLSCAPIMPSKAHLHTRSIS